MGMLDTVEIVAGCPVSYRESYQTYDFGKNLDTITIHKDGRVVNSAGEHMAHITAYARLYDGRTECMLNVQGGVVQSWRRMENHRDLSERAKKFKPWRRNKSKGKKGGEDE